jgi:hypothetical protein
MDNKIITEIKAIIKIIGKIMIIIIKTKIKMM